MSFNHPSSSAVLPMPGSPVISSTVGPGVHERAGSSAAPNQRSIIARSRWRPIRSGCSADRIAVRAARGVRRFAVCASVVERACVPRAHRAAGRVEGVIEHVELESRRGGVRLDPTAAKLVEAPSQHAQRVATAARLVQSPGRVRGRSLVDRVGVDSLLQPRHQLGPAADAERRVDQRGLGALARHSQPSRRLDEALQIESAEGFPAPQRQRRFVGIDGLTQPSRVHVLVADGQSPLELHGVDRRGVDAAARGRPTSPTPRRGRGPCAPTTPRSTGGRAR